ncbi:metallophosphoesterase family protein [Salicibibacter kimchii]|nr:metallophosphoesterase [Salicibibacter kimchii]
MLRFALIGDLHYPILETETAAFKEARQRFFTSFFTDFLQTSADLHVSIGDLTHHGDLNELEQAYQFLKNEPINFKHVLGNHDVYSHEKQTVQTITTQPRYSHLETDEAVLVFLDSTREKKPDDWSGMIDVEQFNWLRHLLEHYQDQRLIVFAHHPLYNTTTRSDQDKASIVSEDPVHDLLANHKTGGFYICGHTHVHSIARKKQWTYIQTAAVYDHPAIRVIEFENGRLHTTLKACEDEHTLENAETVRHHVYKRETPFDIMGATTDRTQTVVLS